MYFSPKCTLYNTQDVSRHPTTKISPVPIQKKKKGMKTVFGRNSDQNPNPCTWDLKFSHPQLVLMCSNMSPDPDQLQLCTKKYRSYCHCKSLTCMLNRSTLRLDPSITHMRPTSCHWYRSETGSSALMLMLGSVPTYRICVGSGFHLDPRYRYTCFHPRCTPLHPYWCSDTVWRQQWHAMDTRGTWICAYKNLSIRFDTTWIHCLFWSIQVPLVTISFMSRSIFLILQPVGSSVDCWKSDSNVWVIRFLHIWQNSVYFKEYIEMH